jgi:hypothetical protein
MKETTYDERALLRKVQRRKELEKSFAGEANTLTDGQKPEITCTQLYSFGNLKRILFNHCSTYKMLYNKDDYTKFIQSTQLKSVEGICASIRVPPPAYSPEHIISKVFIFSQYVAIPYLIIASPLIDKEQKKETIVVFQDIFDNMFTMVEHYRKILKDKTNKRVVLFHYPGQAYTFYQNSLVCNNAYLAGFVDSFFYHLEVKGFINFVEDRIKFIGFGYGGNVLLYYCTILLS